MTSKGTVPCQFCEEKFAPSGIRNHEQWCDENPQPGVPPSLQEDLEGAQTPDQESPGPLPPASTLAPSEGGTESHSSSASEAPTECPECSSTARISGDEALDKYRSSVDSPRSDVCLAFVRADWYCPDCFAVGGVVDEPHELDALLEVS